MKYQPYNVEDGMVEASEELLSEGSPESLPVDVVKRKAEVRRLIELRLDAKRLRKEMDDFDDEDFQEEEDEEDTEEDFD